MKGNLLVISDGNGVDNDFKKWPFYLKILLRKTHHLINRSVVGASNEMIFMRLAEAVATNNISHAIIQWSVPKRLDLIADEFWTNEAANDQTYHFNIVNCLDKPWWVSSKSSNPHVLEYHNKYIKEWQAIQRSQSYMLAAAELLKYHKINFVFSLCYKFEFIHPNTQILQSYPWAWHEKNMGLHEFRFTSKYLEYDTGLAQPHPLIGLDWINTVLRPSCDFIDYEDKTYYNIKDFLLKQCSK